MLILTKLQKFFAATTWDCYFPHIWFSMKRFLTDKSLPPSVDKYFDEWSLSYIRMHFSESVLNVLDLKGNSKLQLLHSKNSGCVPSNDIANPFCAAIKNMHRLITEKKSLNFSFGTTSDEGFLSRQILVSHMKPFCCHITWHLTYKNAGKKNAMAEKNCFKK